jgi:hypothetical protein
VFLPASILALVLLAQPAGSLPNEAKGLHILWVPSAMAGLSNETPGFKVRDPITQVERTFTKAEDLEPMLATLPPPMKANGVWISTSNAFLYVAEETAQLKILSNLAGRRTIRVFLCELAEQPKGWKELKAP